MGKHVMQWPAYCWAARKSRDRFETLLIRNPFLDRKSSLSTLPAAPDLSRMHLPRVVSASLASTSARKRSHLQGDRKIHPLNFNTAICMISLSVEPKSIDVYSMSFAHRYIQDKQRYYADLARVLAPDGMAVITSVGSTKRIAAVQECCDDVGLLLEVIQPRFCSLFNRMHGTSHMIVRPKPMS